MTAPSYDPVLLSRHKLFDSRDADVSPRRIDQYSTQLASIRQVVACLDGSDLGRGVVPHAQQVADALGAHLTLLHVLESESGAGESGIPQDPVDWGIRQRAARAHLKRVVAQLGPLDSEVGAELIQGRPAEQICQWAENHAVDLTVLCSHGSSGLTDWRLASTARKLIDRIPGSLLLVPGMVAARAHEVRYERILVPLDGSARAESVIPVATRIAESLGAEVLLVHVVTAPEVLRLGTPDAEGAELARRVVEHNERIAEEYLDRLRRRISLSSSPVRTLVVSDGSVRAQLVRLIEDEKVDLVVMSAHGMTARVDSPCGNVTEYALTHTTVPLMVLRGRDEVRRRDVLRPSSRARQPVEIPGTLPS